MKQYKFTVVTSFYNRSDWVDTQYKLLLNQTYKNWEWIVTDDFSNELNAEEALKNICKRDTRVKYFKQDYKKQLFYNPSPSNGCNGDIILQTDCDDILSPILMEQYNYWFNKKPEIYLIHTGYVELNDMDFDGNGGWGKNCGWERYHFPEQTKWDAMTYGRAWRNVIPSFEHDGMEWYQNDTNIVRHLENVGKIFFLPRVLYKYNKRGSSVSNIIRSPEEVKSIEAERLIIENRFNKLNQIDEPTYDIDYIETKLLEKSLGFFELGINFSSNSKKVKVIDSNAEPYYNQKLRELYWDWELDIDNLSIKEIGEWGRNNSNKIKSWSLDINKGDFNKKYDAIVWNLYKEERDSKEEIIEILNLLKDTQSGAEFIITFNSLEINIQEFIDEYFNGFFWKWVTMNGDGWIKTWIP